MGLISRYTHAVYSQIHPGIIPRYTQCSVAVIGAFQSSSAEYHSTWRLFYRWKPRCRLLRNVSSVHRVDTYFIELPVWCKPGPLIQFRWGRVPNVLNLYLKPHFMASVLADLGLIPSNRV